MNTELTYELVGGGMAVLALLIGLRGTRSQKRLNAEKSELQTTLKAQITQLTQENETFTEALGLAKGAVTALEQQTTTLSNARDDLQKQLKASDNELKKAKQQLDAAAEQARGEQQSQTSRLAVLQAELTAAKQESAQLVTDKQATEQELSALKAQLSSLESESSQLATVKAELESALSKGGATQSELDRVKDQLTTTQAALEAGTKEKDQLAAERETAENAIATLKQQVSELTTQSESQQAAQKAEAADVVRLEAELATLTQEKEQLATEKQAGQQNAEAKVAELNEQVTALTAQIKTLENALAAETLKQSESQQRVAELEGQLSTLSESYAKDSGSADAQTQLLKGERDRAQQSAEAAKATIAALQAELKEKDTELSAAEKQAQFRLGALEKDLGTQLQQLTQERTSLQDAKSTAEELVKTLQVEMAALNEQNVAFADAAKKADSGKTENQALQQQIASLIQEGSELTQKLTTAEKTIVELQQTSQKLTADKAALEEAMKISQQVIVSLQSAADNSPAGKSLESKSKKSKAKKSTDKAKTDKAATDTVKTDSAPSSPSDATVKETTESKPKADSETTSGALSGKIFVITGTLHEITYEQIAERVTVEGGRINKMPSSKTDYIVVGENPGNKLKKAEKCNVPQLTEAQLLELFASL